MENGKKFRRVLLVCRPQEAQDFIVLISEFADDVTVVSHDNPVGIDLLQLPADCIVIDSRIGDWDLPMVGVCVPTAEGRMMPTLIFYDERPGWEIEHLTRHFAANSKTVLYDRRTAHNELINFLDTTRTVDYASLSEQQPWLMRPFTCSLGEIVRANLLNHHHPMQLDL